MWKQSDLAIDLWKEQMIWSYMMEHIMHILCLCSWAYSALHTRLMEGRQEGEELGKCDIMHKRERLLGFHSSFGEQCGWEMHLPERIT